MTKHNKQLSNLSTTSRSGNRFGIIQLSDLQFGQKHVFGNPSTIAKKLLSDIKKMSGEYDFIPLYLVLSGDITEAANSKEFDDAANVIAVISNELNIAKTNILCIPGNHDVNRELSQESQKTGNGQLKFQPYHKFVSEITSNYYTFEREVYPRFSEDQQRIKDDPQKIDDQFKLELEFLLLNSCEKVDHINANGYICPIKLQKTLWVKEKEESLKIAILHHPLHDSFNDEKPPITNHREIIRILASHEYDIVLTGHVHQGYINALLCGGQHQIIFASCGSTGINHEKRMDGIQNQYCIHVIDIDTNIFQSIWRAYNPSSEYGLGGWVSDNSFEKGNPTVHSLPSKECAGPITSGAKIDIPLLSMADTVSKLTDSGAEAKPKDINITPSEAVATNLEKMKIAIANLLGGWNENA